MIKHAKTALAYLTGIALCGIFAACGEEPQPPPAEEEQTQKKEIHPRRPVSSTFDRTADLDKYTASVRNLSENNDEQTSPERVMAEALRPVSETEAAAKTEILRNKRSSWEIKSAIPAGSFADTILKNTQQPAGKSFVWTPQPVRGDSLTLFRVPDIKLSPDSSLLVFLETMGDASGPYGSRLILMSTSSWQVLNILEFRDRYFEKFEFIPGTTKIAALCLEQKKSGQKQGFAWFDLITGKEERFQQVDPGIGNTAFLADRNQNLIVSHPKRRELLVLFPEKTAVQTIDAAAANAIATLSPDGMELAVLDPEHGQLVEIFRTADWLPASTVNITRTTNAAAFHFTTGNKSFFICGNPDYSAFSTIVRAGRTTALEEPTYGKIVFSPGRKTIYHLTQDSNRIDVLNSLGTKMRSIEVNQARPRLRKKKPGQVTHLFYRFGN